MAGKQTTSEGVPLLREPIRLSVTSTIIETVSGRAFTFNVDFRTLEDAERFQDALRDIHLSLIDFHFSYPLSLSVPFTPKVVKYKPKAMDKRAGRL